MSDDSDPFDSEDDFEFAKALGMSMVPEPTRKSSDVIELLTSDEDDDIEMSSAAGSNDGQLTPKELIAFHNIEDYGVNKTGYVNGDALDSEYSMMQLLFGNIPALKELDKIRDLIEDDMGSEFKPMANRYFTAYNMEEFTRLSIAVVMVQDEIRKYLGVSVDITGTTGQEDRKVSDALKFRFFEYIKKRESLVRKYKEDNKAVFLTGQSAAFIKLFCEQALEIIIAKRVRNSSASSSAASSSAASSSSSSYNQREVMRSAAERRRRNWRQKKIMEAKRRMEKRQRRLVEPNSIELRF